MFSLLVKNMPLFSSCISCVEHHTTTPSNLSTSGDHTHSATSSSGSASSSVPSTSSTLSDTLSIQTFPSLPTLHSFYNYQAAPAHLHAKFELLSSLDTQSAPALALSSNFLYTCSQSNIAVYDLKDVSKTIEINISLHGAVKSAVPCSNTVFTAHQDGKIRAWSKNSQEVHQTASLPTFSDRFSKFAIPSNYVTIRRHNKRLWISHADAVSAVAVDAARNHLFSVSWDKTLKIWNLKTFKCLQSIASAHDDAVNAVAVGTDGTVYTGSADRKIKIWKNEKLISDSNSYPSRSGHVLVATLIKHKSAVNALAVSGDGKVMYSGSNDRSILVWEREDSANYMGCVGVLRGHVKAVMSICAVGIDLVVSGGMDRTVRIWRRGGLGEGYSSLCVLDGHASGVRSVVAGRSGDGDGNGLWVCSGCLGGGVRVWRVLVGSDKKLE